MRGKTDTRPYDGSGYHELRDSGGRLYGKGDYKWCVARLQDVQNHSAERALSEGGWSIRPYGTVAK